MGTNPDLDFVNVPNYLTRYRTLSSLDINSLSKVVYDIRNPSSDWVRTRSQRGKSVISP